VSPPGVALGLGFLALATAFLASHGFDPGERRLERRHAVATSGDEPHYLIILHSLLFDGDLQLEDEYAAAAAGGIAAGSARRGEVLDHHTYFVDAATGDTALWQNHFDYTERVSCDEPGCIPFRPTRPLPFEVDSGGVEVPAHPPAFPALLAAALRPFAVAPEGVEGAAAVVLYAISIATLGLSFAVGLAAGLGPTWSLLATGVLALASPWLPYGKAFFPETTVGLAVTAALLFVLTGSFALAGVGLGLAVVLKPAFAVVAVAWIAERWLAGDRRAAARLILPMAVIGMGLLAFNAAVLGPLAIIGATGSRSGNPFLGALRTLFDPGLGVLLFAPWVVLAVPALFEHSADRDRPQVGRLALVSLALYFPLISIPWALGADCYGPRYWVAFMPWLSVLAADTARRGGRRLRAVAAVLALAGAAIAIPAVLQYADVWGKPPWRALVNLAVR